MPKSLIVAFYAVLSLFLPVTSEAVSLSLAEAEQIARQHSTQLQAADAGIAALQQQPSQAASLADPNISLNILNFPSDTFSGTQENMSQIQLAFSQQLPYPGKLELREQQAIHLASAAEQQRQQLWLRILQQLRQQWWQLAYLQHALQLVQHNQDLLRQLIRVSESKYQTGQGLQQDVLLAQLELSRLLEQEMLIKAQLKHQKSRFNALLGRQTDTPFRLPKLQVSIPDNAIDVAALKQWARQHHPHLRAWREQIKAQDEQVELAQKDLYPDFRLGASYGIRQGHNPVTGKARANLASITLSMNIPLYQSSKQDHAIIQRQKERQQSQWQWQDALFDIQSRIDAAASDARVAKEQLLLFKKGLLPQARQTAEAMLSAYQVSHVDFLNVVRARLNVFNDEIHYWQLYANYQQAMARLMAASGKE